MESNNKIKMGKFTQLLIILITVYCSGYYYSTTVIGSNASVVALIIGFLLLLGNYLLHGANVQMKPNELCFVAFSVLIIILCTVVNGGLFSTILVKQILIIAVSYLIFKSVSFDGFKKTYVKIMFVVMIFALLGQIIKTTSLIYQLPQITNYNGTTYRSGILFSFCDYQYSGITDRIQGLFWEPGLFSSYLLIGFVFAKRDYFKHNSVYLIYIIMLALCLILSRSGAGLLLAPVAVFTKLFSEFNLSKSRRGILLVLFCVAIVALVFFYFGSGSSWVDRYLFIKFDGETSSGADRLNAVKSDFMIFATKFPFGCGINNYSEYCASYHSSGTSTLTGFIAQYGMFGMFFAVALIGKLIKMIRNQSFISGIGLCIIFLGIITKEPHNLLLVMNCLLMYLFLGNRNEIND